MPSNQRSISAIIVPLKTDNRDFEAGLKKAQIKGKKAHADISKDLDKFTLGNGDKAAKALETAFGAAGAKAVVSVGKVTAGVAALGLAAGAAALAVTQIGAAHISQIGNDARSVGATAEAFSRLKGVARATGTDVKDLEEFMRGLSDSINSSIGKTTAQSEVFDKLGTSAEALSKLPVEQQIQRLNKGFAALPNDAARADAAMRLAGQTGIKTFRLLTAGTKDFDKAFNEAPIVTDTEVDAVRRLEIAIGKVTDRIQDFADKFTTMILPPIQKVADIVESMATGLSKVLGFQLPATVAPVVAAPKTQPAPPNNAAIVNQQKKEADDLADKKAEAAKAQAKVVELENRAAKQQQEVEKSATRRLVATRIRNNKVTYRPANYKAIDKLTGTRSELSAARQDADNKTAASLSPAEAMAKATRSNTELNKGITDLRNEFRQDIGNSGQDEIQRRLNGLKGVSPAERKSLEIGAYQAREANRTSALRDELQESTKLPTERLSEDLARISRMVASGSLSKLQGVRAAAQRTSESGVAGGPVQFAGAVDRNSFEGRSAILQQLYGGSNQDMLSVAKQGLSLTGQGNGLLGRLVTAVEGNRGGGVMVGY